MLVTCIGVGRALIPKSTKILNPIAVQIGYAYLLIGFYIFFITTKDLLVTMVLIFTIPGVFIIYKTLIKKEACLIKANKNEINSYLFLSITTISIFAIAAWPYLIKGFGNFWLNGNMDVEDGVFGRDAYLQGLIFSDTLPFISTDWKDFTSLSALRESSPYFLWYAGDEIRLQYSNLAFWSYLLQEKHGIDIVILNLLLNLIMMGIGCFHLASRLFKLNNLQCSLASIACVTSAFYLGTFWAGHIGSNMYGALFPAIVYLFFIPEKKQYWKSILAAFALIILAILFTYHQALIIGISYLLIFKIWEKSALSKIISKLAFINKIRPSLKFLILTIAVALIALILWSKTDSYRLNSSMNYRAWGVVFYPQIISFFIGILSYPSFSLFDIKNPIWVFIGPIIGTIILIVTFFYKGVNNLFLRVFLISWVSGLFLFYIYIQDSYYIYKYLYLHQFLIIIGFCAAIFTRRNLLITLFSIILFFANIAADIGTANSISRLVTNQDSKLYDEILKFGKDNLSSSYLDLGIAERMTVRQILKRNSVEPNKILGESTYVVVHKNTTGEITGEQLGEIIFSTTLLDIRRVPENNIIVLRTTFSEPEHVADYPPFRWIKDGNDDYLEINILKLTPNKIKDKFLRFCTEKGPSAPIELNLYITSGDGKIMSTIPLGEKKCTWLPANMLMNSTLPIYLKTGKTGVRMPFPEDRKLMYRISNIGWSSEANDEISKKFIGKSNR